ncbi:cardioacceleratory peptide receptor-like, partial [Ruditapes philippinarum]|uniref:cardioacceleratory peptide receptor-like n=1 Tax=Ruditapes philippinarum TaxID=129788 RepID=UPI00295A851E
MDDSRYYLENCTFGCPQHNDSFYYYGINDTYDSYFYVDVDVTYWQVPQLIILVALFVLIVFGNVCVLVAIGLSHTEMKTRMNFFIVNLAISDLTVGIFHVIVDFVERCLEVWYGGSVLCKIVRFLQ